MAYGNLAYNMPERERKPAQKRRKPQKRREYEARKAREQMLIRSKNLRRICVIVVIALSAGFMISRFVAVNETQSEIASLQRQLAQAESVTDQMIFDMEQSIDLNKIETEATTRLGMQRPEKYQTIYVNVKKDDITEKTASEVEGPGKRLAAAIKEFGSNIVSFFSIK